MYTIIIRKSLLTWMIYVRTRSFKFLFFQYFKKETGQSFVAYLTGYRMEKAARMLVETNEKSYMIAKM